MGMCVVGADIDGYLGQAQKKTPKFVQSVRAHIGMNLDKNEILLNRWLKLLELSLKNNL